MARTFRRLHSRDEPRWRPTAQYTTVQLPPALRPWLLDDGSLTRHLTRLGTGDFRVQRLWQGWQEPLPSEARRLGVTGRQRALVREVCLVVGGRRAVFARSVFPAHSLTGELAHLRRLRNRSLGAILFRHPGMHRSPFELALIPGRSPFLPGELQQETPAWGRRSRFTIGGKHLLVCEVFLRDFTPWPCILPVHRFQRGRVSAAIRPTNR